MGEDQLVTGGDVTDPDVLTLDVSDWLDLNGTAPIKNDGANAIQFNGSAKTTFPNSATFQNDLSLSQSSNLKTNGATITSTSGDNLSFSAGNDTIFDNLGGAYKFKNSGNDRLTINSSGSVVIEAGPLNFSSSNPIQDNGTDAIQFDGSQNVEIPNGTTTLKFAEIGPTTSSVGTASERPLTVTSSDATKTRVFVDNAGTGDSQVSFADSGSSVASSGWRLSDSTYVVSSSASLNNKVLFEADNDGLKFISGGLNLANSDSIQDNGTDAIQFDGSQNVSIPNGDLSVGAGRETTGGLGDRVQTLGASFDNSGVDFVTYSSSSSNDAPIASFARTRSGTVGTTGTAVQQGDRLGAIEFRADDGTDAFGYSSAFVETVVDGTVSDGIIPTHISFNIENASGNLGEAMRLDSSQSVTIPNGELKLSKAAELQPTSTPSAPSSGWKLYSDSGDGDKLKAIDSAGNVTTIAS